MATKKAASKKTTKKKTLTKKTPTKKPATRKKPARKTTSARTSAKKSSTKRPAPAGDQPTTVAAYIKVLPDDRRTACETLRRTINANIPKGFKETMQYRMPSWVVPHSIYPGGYHCDPSQPLPFLGLASQKSHIGFYHMGVYADAKLLKWFQSEYAKRVATKLDMGKACVRFKKLETIPFDLIGELCAKMTPQQWIDLYEKQIRR